VCWKNAVPGSKPLAPVRQSRATSLRSPLSSRDTASSASRARRYDVSLPAKRSRWRTKESTTVPFSRRSPSVSHS
jgi:hypothetical protein